MALNYGGAALGALGGASTGATLGSVVPVIGTGIGAAGGALVGGLAGLFTGGKGKFKQTPNKYNPQQQGLYDQLMKQTQGNLGGQGFNNIENYAKQQFHSDIIPSLAERFTSLGGSQTRGSSDFIGSLGAAGAGLSSQLAAMRHQYGLDNQRSALELLQHGGTEQYYQPGTEGVGPGLAQAGGQLIGNYAAGGGFSQDQSGNVTIPKQQLQQLLQYLQKGGR